MVQQVELILRPRTRGFHLVTDEVLSALPELPACGLLHLFVKHTSCGLAINENADPDVRTDMESSFNRLVKEREPYYLLNILGIKKILHIFAMRVLQVSEHTKHRFLNESYKSTK